VSDETILATPAAMAARLERQEARLDDWFAVYGGGNNYMTPEMRGMRLCGTVSGHPHHRDGSRVTTSLIVKATGGLAVTESGTRYRLGVPRDSYRKWVEEQPGGRWDEGDPLRVPCKPAGPPEAGAPGAPPDGPGLPPAGSGG
jgi:hypothetical protein